MTNNAKILNPVAKKYTIKLLSGLHIGGSGEGLKIGGIDSQVIKNPLTGEPYIPGSTIKGKMRACLEMIKGDYTEKFGPTENINNGSNIAKAFGMAGKEEKISSRIIFSDFEMTKFYKTIFEEKGSVEFMEAKSENNIPRFLQGNAMPRQIERVPAGVEFEGTITLTPVEGIQAISQDDLEKILDEGIKYLNLFGLGGGVSRGNGRIEIKEI